MIYEFSVCGCHATCQWPMLVNHDKNWLRWRKGWQIWATTTKSKSLFPYIGKLLSTIGKESRKMTGATILLLWVYFTSNREIQKWFLYVSQETSTTTRHTVTRFLSWIIDVIMEELSPHNGGKIIFKSIYSCLCNY